MTYPWPGVEGARRIVAASQPDFGQSANADGAVAAAREIAT